MSSAVTTQTEIELIRSIATSCIALGQHYHQLGDWLESGKATTAAVTAPAAPTAPPPSAAPLIPPPPAPPAALAAPVAPSFPAAPFINVPAAAPAAPGAPAAPAAAKPPRVRRTKAQIAADEAAIAAGYLDAADMAARTGGIPPVAGMPAAPAVQPAQGLPVVQQPPMPPAPVVSAGPSLDDVQAVVMGVIATVENAGWVGHGEGQAGVILQKLGHQTLHAIPAEQRQNVIDWFNHFKNEFIQGKLPQGAMTAGFIS